LLHTGAGELVCCGQPMELMTEKNDDAGQEKHVPVVEKTENGFLVKIGSIPHPMEEKHYIEWVELIIDGISYKQFLKPGDKPEAEFCVQGESIIVREYCNIHGLWKK
jgi:superoxide reductase